MSGRGNVSRPVSTTVYALVCFLAPTAWGVLMYFALELMDRRRRAAAAKRERPPADYSI